VSGGLGGLFSLDEDLYFRGRGLFGELLDPSSVGSGVLMLVLGSAIFSFVADSRLCCFEKLGYGIDSLLSSDGLLTTRRAVSDADILVLDGDRGFCDEDEDEWRP
jgi:hypothetical protein